MDKKKRNYRVIIIFRTLLFLITGLSGVCDTAWGTTIVDDSKKPVAGVMVYTIERDDFQLPPSDTRESSSALTGPDGVVPTFDTPSTRSLIVFKKNGFGTRAFGSSEKLPETVTLSPAVPLTGVILDEDGTSISDALIGPILPGPDMLGNAEGFSPEVTNVTPPRWALTDKHGHFRIDDVEAGLYSFIAQADGKMPRLHLARAGDITSLSLTHEGTTVSGVLVGSRDLAVKANVFVEAAAGHYRLYALTNDFGQFRFDCLPNLEFTFRSSPARDRPLKNTFIAESLLVGAEQQIMLVHDQGKEISGKMLDAETSAPLAGQVITLSAPESQPVTTRTLADGGFLFQNVDAFRSYGIKFDPAAFVFRDNLGNWREEIVLEPGGEDITTAVLPLLARVPLRGRVLDSTNFPRGNAVVHLRSVAEVMVGEELDRPMFYQPVTDADGRFEARVFPAGAYEARAVAENEESETVLCETFTTSPANIILSLNPTVQIYGRVRDASRNPVSAARVELETTLETSATESCRRVSGIAHTDESGSFTLRAVSGARVRLKADHPGFSEDATTEIIVLAAPAQYADLQFSSGHPFSCVLTGVAGPVADAQVQVTFRADAATSAARMLQGRSDDGGRVNFTAINSEAIDQLTVRHPEYAPFSGGPVKLPTADYPVTLQQFPALTVNLTAASGAAPDATVWLLKADAGAASDHEPHPTHFAAFRQQETARQTTTFTNLEPAWYRAVCSIGEMYCESDALKISLDSTDSKVEIPAGVFSNIEGTVKDEATGTPVQGAHAQILFQSGTPLDLQPLETVSGSDGKYRIGRVPLGTHRLFVSHPSYPRFEKLLKVPARNTTQADVILGENLLGEVSGKITLDGQPLSQSAVVVHPVGKPESWLGAVTDAEGAYVIENVPMGSHTMVIEALAGDNFEARRISRAITTSEKNTSIDINLQKFTKVTGRVRLKDAGSGPPQILSLWFTPQRYTGEILQASVNAEGEYSIGVEPGPYKVSLFDGTPKDLFVPDTAVSVRADFEF